MVLFVCYYPVTNTKQQIDQNKITWTVVFLSQSAKVSLAKAQSSLKEVEQGTANRLCRVV